MADWVGEHRDSIRFVVVTLIGVVFIVAGLVGHTEPGLIVMGAGCIGAPGFTAAANHRRAG